jgi:tetratricopeptide (TPR) repeat protein
VSDNFRIQLGLAAQLVKKNQLDQAISVLKALDETYDKDQLVLGMLAGLYFQIGMLERAEIYYKKALGINPRNGLALLQLGLAQVELSRPEDALETWRPMLDDPNDFLAHFHTGLTLLKIGRASEALDYLSIAKENMPANHPYQEKVDEIISSYTSDIG